MTNPSPEAPLRLASWRELALLALLTLCWGLNWPVMKLGVQDYPPLAFRAISMGLGLLVLYVIARIGKVALAAPRAHWRQIMLLGIPNMVIWHVFIILAVKQLSSGRSAILGYTMPLWAALLAWLLYREKLSARAAFGLACAGAGVALLLQQEWLSLSGRPLGLLCALIAAAGWALGTILLKRDAPPLPTICLTFWMLAQALLCLCLGSLLFERAAWRAPDAKTWAAIWYNAVVVFGFAHVAWFRLARLLPPLASGLSVMLIPMVGVFSGAWLLWETPHWQDYAALCLMLLAMGAVLLQKKE
ncbi:DMT family transporter [Massilia sp. W12]|uniref:DMT family transporter n=1 Tax=Massilia sp. W12 TaxID=3126507 RepID=UPI0030D59F8A